MHQLLVTLVSLLFSFFHGGHSTQAVADDSFTPRHAFSFPDRRELARTAGNSSYTEAPCASCLRMNTSFVTR